MASRNSEARKSDVNGFGDATGAAPSKSSREVKDRLKQVKGVVGMSAIKDGWADWAEIYSWLAFDAGNSVFWSVAYVFFLPIIMLQFANIAACPYALDSKFEWFEYAHFNGTDPPLPEFKSTCVAAPRSEATGDMSEYARSYEVSACQEYTDGAPRRCGLQDGPWVTKMQCDLAPDSPFAFSLLHNYTSNATAFGTTVPYQTEVEVKVISVPMLDCPGFDTGNCSHGAIDSAAVRDVGPGSGWRFSHVASNPELFSDISFALVSSSAQCMLCDIGYHCGVNSERRQYRAGYVCDDGFVGRDGTTCRCNDAAPICLGHKVDEESMRTVRSRNLVYEAPCLVNVTHDGLRLAWTPETWAYGSSAVTLTGEHFDASSNLTHRFNQTVTIRVEPVSCSGTVTMFGLNVPAVTFASSIMSLSTGLQAFIMISISAIGDHENYRKRILLATSYLGASALMFMQCVQFVDPYWAYVLTAIIVVVSNVSIGLSIVMYNAYLPFIAVAHPKVRKISKVTKDPNEFLKVYLAVTDELSHMGFAVGYFSGTLGLFISYGFLYGSMASSGVVYGYMNALLFCGVYWFAFTIPFQMFVKERPGVKFPEEWKKYGPISMVAFGWHDTFEVVKRISDIPHTARFMAAFFFYSDGYNTVATTLVFYMQNELNMPLIYIAILNVMTCVFAAFGNYFQMNIQRWPRFKNWDALSFIKLNLLVLLSICAYGNLNLLGFPVLTSNYEFFILVPFYGGCIGAIQSFSRCAMSELCPPSLEAEFFGIFEITDKGSSWMGPAVVAFVVQYYDSACVSKMFPYLILVQLFPLVFLHYKVDLEDGRKDCMSIKVMQWAKQRRAGKASRAKREKRRRQRTAKVGGSSVSSSVSSESGTRKLSSKVSGMSGYLPSANSSVSSVASNVSQHGAASLAESEVGSVAEVASIVDDDDDDGRHRVGIEGDLENQKTEAS